MINIEKQKYNANEQREIVLYGMLVFNIMQGKNEVLFTDFKRETCMSQSLLSIFIRDRKEKFSEMGIAVSGDYHHKYIYISDMDKFVEALKQ